MRAKGRMLGYIRDCNIVHVEPSFTWLWLLVKFCIWITKDTIIEPQATLFYALNFYTLVKCTLF